MPAWLHVHPHQPGAQVSPSPWVLLSGGCRQLGGTGGGTIGSVTPPCCPRCECAPGYVGTNCSKDFDDCQDHRCQNNARCVDEVNGYSCLCAEGYRYCWGG